MYENEREVGQGLRLAGLPREEVWVTTKIFRPDTTYARLRPPSSAPLTSWRWTTSTCY